MSTTNPDNLQPRYKDTWNVHLTLNALEHMPMSIDRIGNVCELPVVLPAAVAELEMEQPHLGPRSTPAGQPKPIDPVL
jgi:hypothetical protein